MSELSPADMLKSNSTTTTTTASPDSSRSSSLVIKALVATLMFIIVVGTIGNILNIIVFSKRSMRQGSTFRFLLYLAITDMLVLLVCSTDALVGFGFQWEIRLQSIFTCRLHTFLTYFLAHSSSIILMIISVDRALVVTNNTLASIFTSVCFCFFKNSNQNPKVNRPKGNKSFVMGKSSEAIASGSCTIYQKENSVANYNLNNSLDCESYPSRSKYRSSFLSNFHRVDIAISSTVVFLVLLNCHYLLFLDLSSFQEEVKTSNAEHSNTTTELLYICYPLNEGPYRTFLINYWIYIDICVYSVIPFVVMSVCSVIILGAVHKTNKSYVGKLVSNLNSDRNRVNIYKRSKKERQILYMLLITILYFFLSQLPYCITFILFLGQKSESTIGQWLVHILSYSNNAINFLFYGLSSQKFRQELLSLFISKSKMAAYNGRCDAATQFEGENRPLRKTAAAKSVHNNNAPSAVVISKKNGIKTNAINQELVRNHRKSLLADIESLNSREDLP